MTAANPNCGLASWLYVLLKQGMPANPGPASTAYVGLVAPWSVSWVVTWKPARFMASTVRGLQAVDSVPPLYVLIPSNANMSAAVCAQTWDKWLRRLLWVQMKIKSAWPFSARPRAVQAASAFSSAFRGAETWTVSLSNVWATSDKIGCNMK